MVHKSLLKKKTKSRDKKYLENQNFAEFFKGTINRIQDIYRDQTLLNLH